MDKVTSELEDMNGLKDDLDALWSVGAAARFLGVSSSALAHWRRDGGGPEFIRLSSNRVKYQRRALLAWIETRRSQSTSAETVAGKTG